MSTSPTDDAAAPGRDDQELVTLVAQGDSVALSELYDRYSPLLLALSRRVLNDLSDAEEVLQEVFLQVWHQASRYQGSRSSVSTWLVMLARSRSIDRLRSRQSRDRTINGLAEQRPRNHTSAEAMGNVLGTERRARLQKEIRALPRDQMRVIELAFYQGLSQSEIAATDDIPLGTVKTRTLLAMKKLRKALGAEMKDYL